VILIIAIGVAIWYFATRDSGTTSPTPTPAVPTTSTSASVVAPTGTS
jgi:hypothetical protein